MHWHAITALLSGRGCLEAHSCLRWKLKISCGRRWERGIATPEFAPRAECRAPRVHPAAKRSGSALKIYPARPETPWCVQGILYVLNSNFQAFLVTPGTPWSPGGTSDVFRKMWFPCSSGLGLLCPAFESHPSN